MIETFPIVPGHVRALWLAPVLVITVLVVFVAIGAVGLSIRGARTARFEVSPEGLRLRGDLYGRMVPASHLQLANARPINVAQDKQFAPVMRTAGTALPGYRSGWFRLRNGERALLYVTDPSRIAYVPTTDGYSMLLSVEDPSAFIAALHRQTAR